MNTRIANRALRIATGLLGCAATVLGQGSGTIHGNVTDPTRLAIAGAMVTSTMVERGSVRTTTTGQDGGYVLPVLPVGSYSIKIEAPGFRQFIRKGIEVTSNENVRVDASLEVGSVSDSISVTAEAPLVDSRSSVVGTLIDTRRITELPINGRNVIALAALLPGAAQVSSPQTFTGDRDGPTVSMSGSRGNQNLFLFDGAHFNAVFRNTGMNYPPPDALAEVKVLTNSFSAEYGRNAGAVFNVVTRSGTNELHGAAWEFLRNQALNARSFFAPSRKPQLIQNQFGAAAGGPIRKDKLFLFGSYEGLRIRPEALSTAAFPPTQAERAGDFSGLKNPVKDPLNGQPFAGGRIPASRFDPVAAKILSPGMVPLPNRPDGQLVETTPQPSNNNMALVRADYNMGKHVIDTRYNYNLAAQRGFAGNVPGYLPLDTRATVQSVTLGDTVAIRPTVLNQVRLSFNRFTSSVVNLNPLHLSKLGSNFPVLGPLIPPAITVSGRVVLGSGSEADTYIVNQSWQFSESVNWTRDRHTVKAGFETLRLRYLNRSSFQTMGVFTFSGQATGNAVADMLLGKAESMTVASPLLEQSGKQSSTYYFVQDDWRVHSRFTLNLGLRYELPLPWVHPLDYWGTFRAGMQSKVIPTAPLGMVFAGDPGVPRGMIPTDKNNFAPRIGFAWDPFGNGRTSVRAAYGLFYETINADVIQNTSQPFRYTFNINAPASLSDPLAGQPPVPQVVNLRNPAFVGLQTLNYPEANLRTPYVQHFNATVQHEVVRDLAIQVGYVGKIGNKLLMSVASNPAVYRPGATLNNLDQRRILQGYGNMINITSQANSRYHALQVEVNKRYSRNFSLKGAYAFSRSIDMHSGTAIGASTPNVFDLSTQIGLSDFHAKHIASLSWMWDLPKLATAMAPARAVLGGWQLNGLITGRSGQPINILSGRDVALSGTNNQRPDVVGDHRLPGDRSEGDKILRWFDRSAFAFPAAGMYGNVGRNALIGPSSFNTNLGLFKNFRLPVREGLTLQFRSEFFSALNNPNFGSPNAQLTAGDRMGRITSAGGARVIQFALKLLF